MVARYLWRNGWWVLLAVIGLFPLAAAERYFWLQFGPGSWGPRFACAQPSWDFGEVATITTLKHDFIITNTGRQTLHLLAVNSECGAPVTARISNREVVAGESSRLSVTVDPVSLRKGPFRMALLLETDDSRLPRVLLFVSGEVG